MNLRFAASLTLIPLALTACNPAAPDAEQDSSSSSMVSAVTSSVRVTRNVSYRGVVEPAGISIYQEGTHRLSLEDGRFILLESASADLSAYEGATVEVRGSLRPTVEAGGIIMDVQTITDLSTPASSSAASQQPSSAESSSSQETSAETASSAAVSKASSIAPLPSSSSMQAASSKALLSSTAASTDAGMQAKITAMLKADLAAGNWSQQYCTAHIGFCVPVHKSWWFQSFGTTTSYLWHVEVSSEEINNIGDGPIKINLVSGSTDADGKVTVQGGVATGYRSWSDGRHFEIIGDASLETAIRYMTQQLISYEEPDA